MCFTFSLILMSFNLKSNVSIHFHFWQLLYQFHRFILIPLNSILVYTCWNACTLTSARCYRLKFNIFAVKRSAKVLRGLKFTRDIVCKLVNNEVSVYLKINYLLINWMQNARRQEKINRTLVSLATIILDFVVKKLWFAILIHVNFHGHISKYLLSRLL